MISGNNIKKNESVVFFEFLEKMMLYLSLKMLSISKPVKYDKVIAVDRKYKRTSWSSMTVPLLVPLNRQISPAIKTTPQTDPARILLKTKNKTPMVAVTKSAKKRKV